MSSEQKYIENFTNLVITEPTGTGKTCFTCATAVASCNKKWIFSEVLSHQCYCKYRLRQKVNLKAGYTS